MAANVPTVRQISYPALILHYAIVMGIIITFTLLDFWQPIFLGAIFYLVMTISLRNIFSSDHIKGIRLFKKEKYTEAIPYFEKSYEHFQRNAWIDKYRYLVMFSASKMSYREMALNNIAFCYGQSGDGVNARKYYERVLEEYPNNGLAKASLRMMNAK